MRAGRQPSGIVHLTAEFWPYARTGGLGQAVAGMANHQAGSGIPTTVLMPLYRTVRELQPDLEQHGRPVTVRIGGVREEVRIWRLAGTRRGPRVLFVDHPASFDRPGIYGGDGGDYGDNARRFALFCLASLEQVARESDPGLVVHAHDWHAALAPVQLRVLFRSRPELARLACVLSVHNAGFQGLFAPETLGEIGLPQDLWSTDRMEWYGRLNYLKGGLLYSDMVTTVSRRHAEELRTEVGGFGLHDTFLGLGDRLVGIRNGINVSVWGPEEDSEIPAHFTADDLSGKAKCKTAMQRAWKLPQRSRLPVFAMSARLVWQKGLDLIIGSGCVGRTPAQFVFLGAGEARYQTALAGLAAEHPEHVAANFRFTDRLEHRLLAGADFLLMPSLYEPCGLTQMRAQHYGTLPVARRVGGLAETIRDGETGFLFDGYAPADFETAVLRAMDAYRDVEGMQRRARAAMLEDFSWKAPAEEYHEVYRRALAAR